MTCSHSGPERYTARSDGHSSRRRPNHRCQGERHAWLSGLSVGPTRTPRPQSASGHAIHAPCLGYCYTETRQLLLNCLDIGSAITRNQVSPQRNRDGQHPDRATVDSRSLSPERIFAPTSQCTCVTRPAASPVTSTGRALRTSISTSRPSSSDSLTTATNLEVGTLSSAGLADTVKEAATAPARSPTDNATHATKPAPTLVIRSLNRHRADSRDMQRLVDRACSGLSPSTGPRRRQSSSRVRPVRLGQRSPLPHVPDQREDSQSYTSRVRRQTS